jgi:hypothetical protein
VTTRSLRVTVDVTQLMTPTGGFTMSMDRQASAFARLRAALAVLVAAMAKRSCSRRTRSPPLRGRSTSAGASRAAVGRNFILDHPQQQIVVGPVSIGRPRLTPAVVQGHAGGVARLALSWTHPVSWDQLAQIQLRLRDGSKLIGLVTTDPRHDVLSGHGSVALMDRASGVQRGGKTVSASLAIGLPRTLAGSNVALDVVAIDRRHHVQTEPDVGAIDVQ